MPDSKLTATQYNDPLHNYLDYWDGRDYENAAEIVAIKRFLKGRHFKHAVDIGGGYGRLCVLLNNYAEKVTLAEPSQQQIDIAADYLKDYPTIERLLVQANDMPWKDGNVDLITMIRVMHHLPDPGPEFKEIARVLAKDGIFILEIANYTHFQNRLKQIAKLKRFGPEPVDIRSPQNRNENEVPFVNHNPKTVIKQLAHAGLKVERTLSVSNLRSPALKKILPAKLMLALEKPMQTTLAKTYFGPSTFLLVKKVA
jgi:ubiquinone/menaquinone biosynthesis C-methylase UbiE